MHMEAVMSSEADYYCVSATTRIDGTFSWLVRGYYSGKSMPGIFIEGTEKFATELKAHAAGARWAAEHLCDAETFLPT